MKKYSEFFTSFKQFISSIKSHHVDDEQNGFRIWLSVTLSALVLTAIGIGIFWWFHSTPKQVMFETQQFTLERTNLAALGKNLNDVSVKLATIEASLKSSKKNTVNISALTAEIASIRQSVLAASYHSQTALAHTILLSSEALQHQLFTIQRQLTAMQTKAMKSTVLPASALPFMVLHIDDIQGEAVVTVRYADTDFPLMIGDSLAGFRVSRADFATQAAIFMNSKNQQVLINLGNITVRAEAAS